MSSLHVSAIQILFIVLCFEHIVCQPQTVVETQCGLVEGKYNRQGYAFRGIPYSLPPTGSRRWKPPTPLTKSTGTCWNGTFQAYAYGNSCLQRNIKDSTVVLGNEDCLYLNVWTPTTNSSANLHVMVWIHGGSLQFLNANYPTYCPSEELARDTNIVYVGMNYRLNAFGFMALDMLSEHSKTNTSGNYGFMDQILALRWVRDNVRNFGGNPDSVTIFGQSSGGTSIIALLASEQARGLFHKAWMLSASAVYNKTSQVASKDNLVFLKNTGCTNITCLYDLSGSDVIKCVPWDVYPNWEMADQLDLPTKGHFNGAIAVVDGDVVPQPPYQAWQQGFATDVPLMIGTTENEIDFDPVQSTMNTWNWTEYEQQVKAHLGTFGSDVAQAALNLYPINVTSPEYEYTRIGSDIRMGCPNDEMSRVISLGMKSPVYRYVVTSQPSEPVHALGLPFPSSYAFHLWDLFAYFDTSKYYIKPLAPSDKRFQETIRREVLSFVRTGVPSTAGWQPYIRGATALLSDDITIVTNYKKGTCLFWSLKGLLNYGWIN